jgi:hypothetical protein
MCNLLCNIHSWAWGSNTTNSMIEPAKGTPCQCGVFLYNGFGKAPLPSKEFAQVFGIEYVAPAPTERDDAARYYGQADAV